MVKLLPDCPAYQSRKHTKPLIEPDGPMCIFAGDHVSHIVAWQEGAALSALRAVSQVNDKAKAAKLAKGLARLRTQESRGAIGSAPAVAPFRFPVGPPMLSGADIHPGDRPRLPVPPAACDFECVAQRRPLLLRRRVPAVPGETIVAAPAPGQHLEPLLGKLPRHCVGNAHQIGIHGIEGSVLRQAKAKGVHAHASSAFPKPAAGVISRALQIEDALAKMPYRVTAIRGSTRARRPPGAA